MSPSVCGARGFAHFQVSPVALLTPPDSRSVTSFPLDRGQCLFPVLPDTSFCAGNSCLALLVVLSRGVINVRVEILPPRLRGPHRTSALYSAHGGAQSLRVLPLPASRTETSADSTAAPAPPGPKETAVWPPGCRRSHLQLLLYPQESTVSWSSTQIFL